MMTRMPPARRRLHRIRSLSLLVSLVLAANAAVLAGGWAVDEPPDVAGAAAVLAASAEPEPAPEPDVDPLSGITVAVPMATAVDGAALPVPEPAPLDPYAATPEVRQGTLEIPSIGLSQPFFEGVTLTAINRGPSHWPGTAMPGQLGNVVIAGHRTTYTKPFWSLDELVPGDELIFTVGAERFVYQLERLEVVSPDAVRIVDQTPERRATLFACHPRGSARQRIVGHFRMAPETLDVQLDDGIGFGRTVTRGL